MLTGIGLESLFSENNENNEYNSENIDNNTENNADSDTNSDSEGRSSDSDSDSEGVGTGRGDRPVWGDSDFTSSKSRLHSALRAVLAPMIEECRGRGRTFSGNSRTFSRNVPGTERWSNDGVRDRDLPLGVSALCWSYYDQNDCKYWLEYSCTFSYILLYLST